MYWRTRLVTEFSPMPAHTRRLVHLRTLATLLLFGLLSTTATAQRCGDTLTRDTVLTTDLHCTSGWVALQIGTSGITLHLNGKTLSGTRALAGIDLLDVDNVEIRGPGRIEGFWTGIRGLRANGTRVANVDFVNLGMGVGLNHSDSLWIEGNRFSNLSSTAVSLHSPVGSVGSGIGGHVIASNTFDHADVGIWLCGSGQSHSLVQGNTFQWVRYYGIRLDDGSNGHRVHGNRFRQTSHTAIAAFSSSENDFSSNEFVEGETAIALNAQLSGHCATTSLSRDVYNNYIRFNRIHKFLTGVSLGLSGSSQPRVTKNWIHQNRIESSRTGLRFLSNAHDNDARSNVFPITFWPIVDSGTGNLY